ncbi:RNA-guided endonuclease InsQ/TnpB family protein [Natronorubrum aibiense]|uniref:IS200/IS605 family element transposase accessory protein TnpB n=1 Tax=Natronorubrum aibiense TaxID=348826 RepID=A0A5P9P335_9EURY|nr:RNA-guided endonuclease TnpB family protein [Natronorubrum aibiense]QFU82544.1 IS200/IS605 family element transposase accessory protein TnpB [Natronorubrum aibiense]
MDYSARFRLLPTTEQRELLGWQRNTVRQVYNHALHRLNQLPEQPDKTVRQRVWHVRDELPTWKDKWPEWSNVYSTVLQAAVERIYHSITGLAQQRDNGHKIGELNWKKPREFQSFTYRQRGFELDRKSGRDGRGRLILKKVRGETIEIPIRLHRDLPDDAEVKHVSVKQEATGAWYASFNIEHKNPEKPDVEDIDPADAVGLDLGVLNFIHDSDGRSIDRLDLSDDRERLEREQRSLSRKEYESKNWERQRRRVAEVHIDMWNKKRDFKHKLAHFYTREYDAVFVEDLDVRGMLENGGNARNKAEVGWRDFIRVLKHHGRKHGCHVVEVEPAGTTKECSRCGAETVKPLWVREHSCPSCGLELDRDWNAALNVFSRGLEDIGVVHSEATTPVETATAVDTYSVSASRVVEAGSPCLKEAA